MLTCTCKTKIKLKLKKPKAFHLSSLKLQLLHGKNPFEKVVCLICQLHIFANIIRGANSVEPGQTARSSLIWVCTVCGKGF